MYISEEETLDQVEDSNLGLFALESGVIPFCHGSLCVAVLNGDLSGYANKPKDQTHFGLRIQRHIEFYDFAPLKMGGIVKVRISMKTFSKPLKYLSYSIESSSPEIFQEIELATDEERISVTPVNMLHLLFSYTNRYA